MFLLRFECVCTTCTFEHYVISSGNKVTTLLPPQVRRCLCAYDSCDYPKRPIRQQRHSRPDRIAFYLYDRDDANDKLYDKWKLPETTHMVETTMWKPDLTCHWRPLCRRDRTQFHRGDRVAAVVWVVLDNRMSVFTWSSHSDDRYDRDRDYMATWLYTKK